MATLASPAKLITTLKYPREIKIFNINSEKQISEINEEYLFTHELIFHICSSNEMKILATTTTFKPLELIVIQYGENNTYQVYEIISISTDKGIEKAKVSVDSFINDISLVQNHDTKLIFGVKAIEPMKHIKQSLAVSREDNINKIVKKPKGSSSRQMLWQFIVMILSETDNEYEAIICWVNKKEKIFRIKDLTLFTKFWELQKCKENIKIASMRIVLLDYCNTGRIAKFKLISVNHIMSDDYTFQFENYDIVSKHPKATYKWILMSEIIVGENLQEEPTEKIMVTIDIELSVQQMFIIIAAKTEINIKRFYALVSKFEILPANYILANLSEQEKGFVKLEIEIYENRRYININDIIKLKESENITTKRFISVDEVSNASTLQNSVKPQSKNSISVRKTHLGPRHFPKNKSGEPKVATRTGRNGNYELWEFLLDTLLNPKHKRFIEWVGDEGDFNLIKPKKISDMWGKTKGNKHMTYEKLSRAMRDYYGGDMLMKSKKQFHYKFIADIKELTGYTISELKQGKHLHSVPKK